MTKQEASQAQRNFISKLQRQCLEGYDQINKESIRTAPDSYTIEMEIERTLNFNDPWGIHHNPIWHTASPNETLRKLCQFVVPQAANWVSAGMPIPELDKGKASRVIDFLKDWKVGSLYIFLHFLDPEGLLEKIKEEQ